MKSKVLTCVKLAVTVILFGYVFKKIDFYQFGVTLKNARLDILIAGFLVIWIAHYICIYRWRMLMRPLMPILSLTQLFGIYCIGLFFNLTFPTAVGGDVVKMYYAGKPSKAYAQSFAATFLDRDAGMLAMMVIACVAIVIHPVALPGIHVPLIIWGVSALFVAGNIAVFAPHFHRKLTDVLHWMSLSKMAKKVDTISGAFQVMGRHQGVLLSSLLISFVNQLLVIAVTWIMALGLRLNISFPWFLIFIPVITLVQMIPVSVGGMGLRESAFMSLFGAIGVAPASCLALGLLSSIVIILSSLPGGIVYMFFRNRNDMQQLAAFETEFS